MKIPSSLLLRFLESEFQVKRTQDANEVRINSPFNDDKKFKLYINIKDGVYIDFKGDSGSILSFLSQYLDLPKEQILQYLLNNYGVGEEIEQVNNEKSETENIDNSLKDVTWFGINKKISLIGSKYFKYLQDRQIPQKYINKWGYVYNDMNEYNQRIVIPFYENNDIVYFTARSIEKDTKVRYKNPHLNSKEFLFNYDDIYNDRPLVIVEGVMDAVSVENFIATAMLSADISSNQIRKIAERGVTEIIMVPDQDETGLKKLQKNIDALFYYYPPSLKLKIYTYDLPKGFKDFNEFRCKTQNGNIDESKLRVYQKNTSILKNWSFVSKLIV